ncbi:hypothetical protein GCM10020295_66870 [Streptomyces cinereospinus]
MLASRVRAPGAASCQVAAFASCQPQKLATPRVARPPAADREVQRLQRLLQRGAGVEGVDVPHVDVVRAEPGERGVERGQQVPPRPVEPPVRVRRAPGLGRQHQVRTRHQSFHEPSEQVLGLAVPVDVGGVDERPAGLPERLQQVRGVVLVGVPPPGQGAESDP